MNNKSPDKTAGSLIAKLKLITLPGLILLLLAGFQAQPVNIDPETPEVDNSRQVVESAIEDFTIMNGTVYWTHSGGDLYNYNTYIKSQQLNDKTTQTTLLDLPASFPYVFRELLADPVHLYYKNETNHRIEKRHFSNFQSATTLFSYSETNEPTGLALADGYVYWSSKDKTIRRIPIGGGSAQKVADTNGIPVDISIDEENIWFGGATGVYWIKRNCSLPCSPRLVYTTNVKKLYGAGRADPTYNQAVFWIANNDSSPNTVESWDCDVPGKKGCYHKVLYRGTENFSVDGLSASDANVFWIEIDNSTPPSRFLRRAPRNCVTPCPAGSIDKLVDPVTPLSGTWAPVPMILDDVDIYFKHQGISKIAQNAAPIVWNLVYDGMEVTQVTQSLLNDVRLVAGKPTFVRLYAHLTVGENLLAPEARLVGTRNNVALPGSPLQPVKRPSKLAVGDAFDRDNMDSSWLFELPPAWIDIGTIVLKGEIDARKLYDSTPPVSPLTEVTFEYRPPICVVALKVSQHGPTARHTDPEFQLALRTAEMLLPTPDIWLYHQGMVLEEGIWPFYSPYEMQSDSDKLITNIWWRDKFSDDPDECQDAFGRTLFTGMISPKIISGGTNGSAFVGFDQSWTKVPYSGKEWSKYAGWPLGGREATMAHEFGHNFNREHVNCPNGVPADTESYPYDPCVLSPTDGSYVYYGYDMMSSEAITPTEGSDLMSYKGPRWISDHTWEKIFANNAPLILPLAIESVAASSDLVLSGVLDTNNPENSELNYTWVMPAGSLSPGLQAKWAQDAAANEKNSVQAAPRIFVRFLGIRNAVLAEHDVTLMPIREGSNNQAFNLTATAPSAIVTKILLFSDSTVLATRTPGLFVPQVSITSPKWGAVADDSLTVIWTANDNNGDTLKFIVQISHDLGLHWQTLGTEIIGSPDNSKYKATFDTTTIPGSDGVKAIVRVIASDGYNTALATSEEFLTVSKAPEAYISAPANGVWFDAGQTIRLDGSGTDAEDGHMPGSALSWTLNSTAIGTGEFHQLPGLKPGSYNANLTATDLDYKTGTATAAFTIAPWQIGEGKAKLDGRCTDSAYADTQPLQLKPYSDGSQASVFAVRNDQYIWFCFSGLNNGTNFANSFAGVRLDTNYSQDSWAQSNDYGFFIRPDGAQFTRQGNGSGGFNEATLSFVNNSLASKVRTDVSGRTWSAELRIEYYYTGLWDRIAVDLGHYWVNGQGNDYHWPYTAQYNKPDTWAEAYGDPAPQITQISPENTTLPKTSLTLNITGLNFRSGDKVLWNGKSLRVTFINSTTLSAIVQGSNLVAGEHKVQVMRDAAGEIRSGPMFVQVSNPVPVLTSLSPGIAAKRSDDLVISIFGSSFVSGAVVYWDNQEIAPTYISSTQLDILVDGAELTRKGLRTIVVSNPDPTENVSNALIFTIAEGQIFLPSIVR